MTFNAKTRPTVALHLKTGTYCKTAHTIQCHIYTVIDPTMAMPIKMLDPSDSRFRSSSCTKHYISPVKQGGPTLKLHYFTIQWRLNGLHNGKCEQVKKLQA